MARTVNAVEVNKFNAGLITDASPLTTPDNSSLDEDNFVLNIDGSRNRRLGMDYEEDFDIIDTTIPFVDGISIGARTFKWNNAGGEPSRSILVVQVGNALDFFHLGDASVSSGFFKRETFPTSSTSVKFSFATVDGLLVVVNGDKDVYIFEYVDPDSLTRSTKRVLIRDFFGVDDIVVGVDITRGTEVSNRIFSFNTNHIYNLRNQSWGIPRPNANDEATMDPILAFVNVSSGTTWPSNADSVTGSIYPDAGDAEDRILYRFWPNDIYKNPPGTARAPQGYFIIDALDRGASRLAENSKNHTRYGALTYPISSLPTDMTPSGATSITEFAGRVFYSGYTGEVTGGDGHSPKLSSYIFFSKLVESSADIIACYQVGDPTSKDFPDIVDTDGGFIRINEAYGIQKLVNLGSSLMVVAKNGVWRVVGGSDNGFTATAYIVEKITDKGCTSPDSIIVVDNALIFWSDDAIYAISPDQFGSWQGSNISLGKIQRLYDDINIGDKQLAHGAYDTYERKARWIYYNSTTSTEPVKELVYDIQLQAFYTNTIQQIDSQVYPKPVSMFTGLSYTVDANDTLITVGGDQVVVAGDPVIMSSEERLGTNQRELGYLVITSITGTISYTFAKYTDLDFRDWRSDDGVGVDAPAYLITSYLSGGDFQRDKRVPYITMHFRRTETGYDEDMNPINPSSCFLQSRWDWSDSDRSGKWGREFQAYRYRRMYLPVDEFDTYDNGFSTIITRNKLRGNGKVLSLKVRTEPYNNLHLYGWSIILTVAENV